MRTSSSRARTLVCSAVAMIVASAASAQVPNASAAATGLSGAYSARARGYDAIAWNPANLGMPGGPDFSISLLAFSGASGLDPISLGDVAPYSGKALPAVQREKWLQAITTNGGENGRFDGGLTGIAMSAGPFAVSVSASVAGSTTISPDAFEALMFGNAGRTGSPATLSLKGSTIHAGAFTTAAASYGFGMGDEKSGKHFSFGVTGKYVLGNALALAQDQGSTTTPDAVTVNFPAVISRPDSNIVAGSGIGVDVGMAWSTRSTRWSVAVMNALNTFAWDESKLYAKTATALFNASTDTSAFPDKPYASAPASLRAMVANDKFKPVVSAGFAYELNGVTTFSADVRQRIGDGIAIGPKTQAAGGLEFRGVPFLTLRGGAAYITNGWGVSAGASLHVGPMDVGVGAGMRHVNGGQEPVLTVNVLSFR